MLSGVQDVLFMIWVVGNLQKFYILWGSETNVRGMDCIVLRTYLGTRI